MFSIGYNFPDIWTGKSLVVLCLSVIPSVFYALTVLFADKVRNKSDDYLTIIYVADTVQWSLRR